MPYLSAVAVDQVVKVGSALRITARCTAPITRCTACGVSSGRAHSRYVRRLADTAIGGQATGIDLEVRRFFCDNSECPKKTFAEQVDGLTFRYGRRTVPIQKVMERLALALGGRAGERLAMHLFVPVSDSTLLRLIRRLELPVIGEVEVLGVDEFAFRRVIYSRPEGVLDVVQAAVSPGDLRDGGGYLRPSITRNSGRGHACSASRVADDTAGIVDSTG
ncbi:hypothetical protein GCM10022403_078820 [Streptomyces coacervatus]|uniref:Transposase IS204/IS1001/IS1096/IS1165 zinc-finger domain-containing protein n=2 Tax=Streptomyces coacervatus TaxID=647381 RepID=A0ABP7J3U4_9ACTN